MEPMRFTDVPELSDAAELYKDKSSARSASRRSPEDGAEAAAANGGNSFDFVNGNNRHSKRGYTSPSGTVPWCQSATDNNGNNGNNGNHGNNFGNNLPSSARGPLEGSADEFTSRPLAGQADEDGNFRVPPEDPSRALQTNSPVDPSRVRLTFPMIPVDQPLVRLRIPVDQPRVRLKNCVDNAVSMSRRQLSCQRLGQIPDTRTDTG